VAESYHTTKDKARKTPIISKAGISTYNIKHNELHCKRWPFER